MRVKICYLALFVLALLLPSSSVAAITSGQTTLNKYWTTNKSPYTDGTVPSQCSDVGLTIAKSTAVTLDGSNSLTKLSLYHPGFTISNGNFNYNFSTAGIKLDNGVYNIFVGACNLAYGDLYTSALYIVPNGCDSSCLPLYRFYKPYEDQHFYTTSETETYSLIKYHSDAFKFEGIDSFVPSTGNISVHRFYNFITGEHFYTSNQAEATYINFNLTNMYHYEGVSYLANSGPGTNSTPIHRFYNLFNGDHFYTSNQAEATNINFNMANTFRYEGISWYDVANN